MAANTSPESLHHYYPGGFFGFDIEGRPLFIEPLGRIDFQGILNTATPEEVLDFKRKHFRELDTRCKEQEQKLGTTFKKRAVLLMDSEGGNFSHLWKPGLSLYKSILDMVEVEFPDLFYRVLIVNTPFIFPVIWSLLKPFLTHESKERTVIFGRNWKQEILNYVDGDNLPEYYGGNCRDKNGSPKCEEYICYGGSVPKTLYIKNINLMNQKFEGFDNIDLAPGAFHHITRVASPHCTSFKYQFISCGGNILFSVFLENDGQLQCVVKESEYEKMFLHEESVVCQKKRGTYLFQFCLPESATGSDKVFYTILECSNDGGM